MQWIGTITHMFEVNQEEYISYYYAFNQLQLRYILLLALAQSTMLS